MRKSEPGTLAAALLATASVGVVFAARAQPDHPPEVCGDVRDNNGNRLADEGCHPAAVTGVCESPLSCGKSGAVSPKTGALVYHVPPDLEARVPYGPALALRRFYASQYDPGYFPSGVADSTHPLGIGWQHNYMSWLRKHAGTGPATAVLHTTAAARRSASAGTDGATGSSTARRPGRTTAATTPTTRATTWSR